MVTTFNFTLPQLPSNWDEEVEVKVHKRLSKSFSKAIEPAGDAFSSRVRRHRLKRTLEEDYQMTQALLDAGEDNGDEEEEEEESKALLRSDPSKWKTQDHYAVLGLSSKRYLATDDDIKRAYRRKVLKHHPDKTAAVGGSDSFFKCIQRAWEILTDRKKRRQFDSCDPTFDETLPAAKVNAEFYNVYSSKFKSEVRFSKSPTTTTFGDAESSRENVEAFYQFWFAFESWRTFEMRDEEDTDKADSRDEKRWLDRKNFAARKKHKKEDNQRLNKLVEQAFGLDPRIKKFKEEEKYIKNTKKREREAAELAAAEEVRKIAEAEKLAKEKLEEEEKNRSAAEKKDKDAAKNVVKKEKKTIRRIFRDSNSFLGPNGSADEISFQNANLESVLNSNDAEYLESLRKQMEAATASGYVALGLILDAENLALNEKENAAVATFDWSQKAKDALVASFKKQSIATADKWQLIAADVSAAAGSAPSQKACIEQAKKVQSLLGGAANTAKPAASTAARVAKSTTAAPAAAKTAAVAKAPAPAATNPNVPTMLLPENDDWTTQQQLSLEAALKKFPASAFIKNPADRFEKLSGEITGKDKKQVKDRLKKLADLQKKSSKK